MKVERSIKCQRESDLKHIYKELLVRYDQSNESYKQFFHVVPLIMRLKGGSNLFSVDKILKYDHLNKSFGAVLPSCAINKYMFKKEILTFPAVLL